jgi:hypothetical protein
MFAIKVIEKASLQRNRAKQKVCLTVIVADVGN